VPMEVAPLEKDGLCDGICDGICGFGGTLVGTLVGGLLLLLLLPPWLCFVALVYGFRRVVFRLPLSSGVADMARRDGKAVFCCCRKWAAILSASPWLRERRWKDWLALLPDGRWRFCGRRWVLLVTERVRPGGRVVNPEFWL
jgi:hypothetical protein